MPWQNLPTGTLRRLTNASLAELVRGDAQIPRFFLTGDGHRLPPFAWIDACPELRLHFQTLMGQGLLSAHVEEHQEDVSDESVHPYLHPLFLHRRIFGWEVDIYRNLRRIMEQCLELAGGSLHPATVTDDVVALDREIVRVHALLWEIGNPASLPDLMTLSEGFRRYYLGVSRGQARDLQTEDKYRQFLINYNNWAMALRTDINPYIGKNINRAVAQCPDNGTHLITCGDAHIMLNPLQQYVTLPHGVLGVVDASNM